MPRLPILPQDVSFDNEEDNKVLTSIKAKRPAGLTGLDQVLLHAPKVAGPWFELASAIRFRTSLPDSIREMTICRVYAINNIEEELQMHSAHLLRCSDSGITPGILDFIKTCPNGRILEDYQAAGLHETQAAVLALADASTTMVQVPLAIIDFAKEHYSSKELVELVAAVAMHNAVARVFGALDVKLSP